MPESSSASTGERRLQPRTPTDRWQTALTSIAPNTILIRGYPVDEMMGRLWFADAVYLLLMGELPSPAIGRMLNAVLVSSLDHGVAPPPPRLRHEMWRPPARHSRTRSRPAFWRSDPIMEAISSRACGFSISASRLCGRGNRFNRPPTASLPTIYARARRPQDLATGSILATRAPPSSFRWPWNTSSKVST